MNFLSSKTQLIYLKIMKLKMLIIFILYFYLQMLFSMIKHFCPTFKKDNLFYFKVFTMFALPHYLKIRTSFLKIELILPIIKEIQQSFININNL